MEGFALELPALGIVMQTAAFLLKRKVNSQTACWQQAMALALAAMLLSAGRCTGEEFLEMVVLALQGIVG